MSNGNQEYWDAMLSKYAEMSNEEFEGLVDAVESSDEDSWMIAAPHPVNEKSFKIFTDIDDWLEDREPGDEFTLVIEYWTESPYSYHSVEKTDYVKLDNGFWKSTVFGDEIRSTSVDVIAEMMGAILRDRTVYVKYRDIVINFHKDAKGLAEYCLWKGVCENHNDLNEIRRRQYVR